MSQKVRRYGVLWDAPEDGHAKEFSSMKVAELHRMAVGEGKVRKVNRVYEVQLRDGRVVRCVRGEDNKYWLTEEGGDVIKDWQVLRVRDVTLARDL